MAVANSTCSVQYPPAEQAADAGCFQEQTAASAPQPLEPEQLVDSIGSLMLPDKGPPPAQFCLQLERLLQQATWTGVQATQAALPAEMLKSIVLGVTPILSKEPTVMEVQPCTLEMRVTVVGDTHGQYHDLCKLFSLYGHPSADRIYIFNGDYVDRGAWGVETLTLLLAWKWVLPNNVYLLRGNHETNMITRVYGFYAEIKAKYGSQAKGLFTHIRRMFAHLPLAALVANSTLILHGGLFRAPPKKGKGSKRRRSVGALTLGTLDDLRTASKGGQDPDPERSMKNVIANDVLWSDPVNSPGLRINEARGCGTVFGPDTTESFLSSNGLKLIIRSHEGPDARDKRLEENKMPSVDSGYAVDHDTTSGRLVTLFSAPDYPQFMAEGEERYRNKAAVLHLNAPDYATPTVECFEAHLPRPHAESYYDISGFSEDEDEEDGQADCLGDDELMQAQDVVAEEKLAVQQPATAPSNTAASGLAAAGGLAVTQALQLSAEAIEQPTVATNNEVPVAESQADIQQQEQPSSLQVQGVHQQQQQSQAGNPRDQQAADSDQQTKLPAPLSPLQQQNLTMSLQHQALPGDDNGRPLDAVHQPNAAANDDRMRILEAEEPAVKRHKAVHRSS